MKKTVSKKDISEAMEIINKEGYWSNELQEFFSNFTYHAMQRLDTKVKMIIREGVL